MSSLYRPGSSGVPIHVHDRLACLGHGHSASRLNKKAPKSCHGECFSNAWGAVNNSRPHWSTGGESRTPLLLEEGPFRALEGRSAGAQSLKPAAAFTSGKWVSHEALRASEGSSTAIVTGLVFGQSAYGKMPSRALHDMVTPTNTLIHVICVFSKDLHVHVPISLRTYSASRESRWSFPPGTAHECGSP